MAEYPYYPESIQADYDDGKEGVSGKWWKRSGAGWKYLRADTCTPNEKLEELIKEVVGIAPESHNLQFANGQRAMRDEIIKRLREVMK